MSNYPPGTTDDDPHFTDTTLPEEPEPPCVACHQPDHPPTDHNFVQDHHDVYDIGWAAR